MHVRVRVRVRVPSRHAVRFVCLVGCVRVTLRRFQTGFVNNSVENTYFFDVPATASGFKVTVTTVYGDPDIYLNLNASKAPTPTSYDYRAISSSSEDSITINATLPKFQTCVQSTFSDHSRCRVYIGVYGFRASQYRCDLAARLRFPVAWVRHRGYVFRVF